MRWGQPSEKTQLWLASPLLVLFSPAFLIFAAVIAVVIYAEKAKRWLVGPSKDWRWWFAWYPVRPGTWPDQGRWIWLERVERRVQSHHGREETVIREIGP